METLLNNPANGSLFERPTIFLGVNGIYTKLHAKDTETDNYSGNDNYKTFGWERFAASVPFKIYKKRLVISVSYYSTRNMSLDGNHISPFNPYDVKTEFSGNAKLVSLGLGVELKPDISIGLGWTKWMGKNKWRYEDYRKGINHFSGSNWYFGMNSQFKKFYLGSVIYLPFTLSNGESYFINDFPAWKLEHSQKFRGAFKVNLAYQIRSSWMIGFGFSYQRGFYIQYREKSRQYKDHYSKAIKLSGGVEYMFDFDHFRLPLYLGYHVYRMPEHDDSIWEFGNITIRDDNIYRNELVAGAHVLFDSTEVYMDVKWSHNDFHVVYYGTPPYS